MVIFSDQYGREVCNGIEGAPPSGCLDEVAWFIFNALLQIVI